MKPAQHQPSLISLLQAASPEQFAQAAAAVVRRLKACQQIKLRTESLPRLLIEALQEAARDPLETKTQAPAWTETRNYGQQYLCLDKWDG